MRVLAFIALVLAGLGAIAYSYIGAFAKIGEELTAAETPGGAFSLVMSVLEAIASGQVPQLTGYLYGGLLLIAVGVVTLIMKGAKRDE